MAIWEITKPNSAVIDQTGHVSPVQRSLLQTLHLFHYLRITGDCPCPFSPASSKHIYWSAFDWTAQSLPVFCFEIQSSERTIVADCLLVKTQKKVIPAISFFFPLATLQKDNLLALHLRHPGYHLHYHRHQHHYYYHHDYHRNFFFFFFYLRDYS